MKIVKNYSVISFLTMFVFITTLNIATGNGIPEPEVIIYGKVLDRGTLLEEGELEISYIPINDSSEGITVKVSLDKHLGAEPKNEVFSYKAKIPVETVFKGSEPSPNCLPLNPQEVTYKRLFCVNINGETYQFTDIKTYEPMGLRGFVERKDLILKYAEPEITLLTPPEGGAVAYGTYTIRWTDEDPDSNAKISLFYDNDPEGCDGTTITTGISEDDETDSYVWDLTGLPTGIYWIYAIIDDGINPPVCRYAPGALIINAPPIPIPIIVTNKNQYIAFSRCLWVLCLFSGAFSIIFFA